MDIVYQASATAEGGREGKVRTSDGVLDIRVGMPLPELGGTQEPLTNPEQLFAAGYVVCFESVFMAAARRKRMAVEGR